MYVTGIKVGGAFSPKQRQDTVKDKKHDLGITGVIKNLAIVSSSLAPVQIILESSAFV